MDEIQVFNNPAFGFIRSVEVDGIPYFVGKDIAEILGYKDTSDAIKRHVDEEDKLTRCFTDSGQNREMYIINESGLYSLILTSKMPFAKEFKQWVTSKVLPSLRQNGGYIMNQEALTPEQIVANALVVAQNIIANKDRQIETMKPKAEFFDAVTSSRDAIEIGKVAKVLGFKGYGRNNLFEFLRTRGILMGNNQPYQKYIDCGYFRVIEQKYTKPDGETVITFKTLVYQKGVNYIRKLLQREVAQ